MTKPQKIEGGWEQEFDELAVPDGDSEPDGQGGYTASYDRLVVTLTKEQDYVIRNFISSEIEKAKAEATEDVLRMVGDILPYSVGFTGRFYALKDELLNSKSK